MTKAQDIAGRLSGSSAAALVAFEPGVAHGPGTPHAATAFKGPHVRRGLLRVTNFANGPHHEITDLGLEVRAILQEQNHHA